MPTYPKASTFVPHPAGAYAAVLCDVIDLGEVETEWKGEKRKQPKVILRFQTEEEMESGTRFTVQRRFTNISTPRGALRPFLESWLGRPFKSGELERLDLETLIGTPAWLSIMHEESNGTTYTNITSCTRLPAQVPPPAIVNYTRDRERDRTA